MVPIFVLEGVRAVGKCGVTSFYCAWVFGTTPQGWRTERKLVPNLMICLVSYAVAKGGSVSDPGRDAMNENNCFPLTATLRYWRLKPCSSQVPCCTTRSSVKEVHRHVLTACVINLPLLSHPVEWEKQVDCTYKRLIWRNTYTRKL